MKNYKNRKMFFLFCLITGFSLGYIANRYVDIMVQNHQFMQLSEVWPYIRQNPFYLSMEEQSFITFALVLFLSLLFFLYHFYDYKNYRENEEHGSARWANNQDRKNLIVEKDNSNVILSATEMLSTDMEKTGMNNNILCIGGPSRGKSYKVLVPNLMQANNSFVVTDPKGTTLTRIGKFLENEKYKVREFNTVFFERSYHWNPFVYFKSETSIMRFVTALIKNTKSPDERASLDPFWEKAEILLYCALISYIMDYCRPDDQNINSLVKLLDSIEVREDNDDFVCTVDILFEEAEINNPNAFCVKQYHKFKNAAGKTLKSILATTGGRMQPFDIPEISELMSYDELELQKLGEEKTALFIVSDDSDSTFNFLVALLQTQIIQVSKSIADSHVNGELKIPLCLFLDEFANTGIIPDFQKEITTLRSRLISAVIFIQTVSQLKAIYKENAETIQGACDTWIFLGGREPSTLKMLSEVIGKETVHIRNHNVQKGMHGHYTMNYSSIARDLITPDELGRLKRDECIVLVAGFYPFKSKKYNPKKHPNYQKTGFADNNLLYKPKLTISTRALHSFALNEDLDTMNLGEA